MTQQDFGQRVRDIRKQRGLTQGALAVLVGYTSAAAISKIEKGQMDVPLSIIFLLANALDVPVIVFFHDPDMTTIPLPRDLVKDIQDRFRTIQDDFKKVLLTS